MTDAEIEGCSGGRPGGCSGADWRRDVVTLGEVPGDFMREVSGGKLDTWRPR